MRIAGLIFLLSISTMVPAAQQSHTEAAQARESRQQMNRMAPDDVESLRQDLARMKAIVHQMETNLAFVDNTQSPLKHQFQLEIDMWNTLIAEMERKLPPAAH